MTVETVQLGDDQLPVTVAQAGVVDGRVGVVIVPSIFGIQPDLVAQMQELARDATLVAAIDPFFRDGRGVIAYDDMPQVRQRFGDIDLRQTRADLKATLDWAREQAGVDRILLLGICFGGGFALRAAADGWVDGVVTWHGSRMEALVDRAAEMQCPMHHHVGGNDPIVPPKALASLRAAFAGRPNVQWFVHDGVAHGFTHRQASAAFHEPAEAASMASVRELVGALERS